MAEFNVEVDTLKTQSNLAILRLSGSLDSYSVGQLEKVFSELMTDQKIHLVVNCQKIKFISSAGIGLFLGTLSELEKQGGSLCLAEVVSPEVRDVMSVLGLFDVFRVFEQETEALRKN